jgi:exonuclease 1
MGIKDFHIEVRPYVQNVHISRFRHQRVGCDASSWLFRGAVASAWHIQHNEQPWKERNLPPPWVDFSLKLIRLLRANGVEPVLVFDGKRNPAKAATNAERRRKKENARIEANAMMQKGNNEAAAKKLQQAIDVTPAMAHDLIVVLRKWNVHYVMAPYEADAQLAYLAMQPPERGGVAAIVTEDSDLVVYVVYCLFFLPVLPYDKWSHYLVLAVCVAISERKPYTRHMLFSPCEGEGHTTLDQSVSGF